MYNREKSSVCLKVHETPSIVLPTSSVDDFVWLLCSAKAPPLLHVQIATDIFESAQLVAAHGVHVVDLP